MDTSVATIRPQLLKVLCILSLIGGLYFVVYGAVESFTEIPARLVAFQDRQNQANMEKLGPDHPLNKMNEGQAGMMAKSVEYAKPLGYSHIGLGLLSLAGVWFMWNLKKIGFALYVLAQVGLHTGSFLALGTEDEWGNASQVFGAVVTIVFIVLYAVNLKHMRN